MQKYFALCFSITATIMFLSVLTSRHREKDFVKDLPIKLLAGLTFLFLSILAILVSFCSAHFFMLQRELRSYALPMYAVTCLPATLFAIAQLPLYLDLLLTTFIRVPQHPLEDNAWGCSMILPSIFELYGDSFFICSST